MPLAARTSRKIPQWGIVLLGIGAVLVYTPQTWLSVPLELSQQADTPANPAASRRTRVAILFSGQPRFVTGIARATYQRFFLEPYDCDVYGAFGAKAGTNLTQYLDPFVAAYTPVAVDAYYDNEHELYDQMFPPPAKPAYHGIFNYFSDTGADPGNRFKVVALFESLRRVADLFDRARGARQYDWIVRARTDNVITAALNLTALPPGYIYFADLTAIVNVPRHIKNELYVLPGNVPAALDVLRKGVGSLRRLNGPPHGASFCDENLFQRLVYDLRLDGIARVTDHLQRMVSRFFLL